MDFARNLKEQHDQDRGGNRGGYQGSSRGNNRGGNRGSFVASSHTDHQHIKEGMPDISISHPSHD